MGVQVGTLGQLGGQPGNEISEHYLWVQMISNSHLFSGGGNQSRFIGPHRISPCFNIGYPDAQGEHTVRPFYLLPDRVMTQSALIKSHGWGCSSGKADLLLRVVAKGNSTFRSVSRLPWSNRNAPVRHRPKLRDSGFCSGELLPLQHIHSRCSGLTTWEMQGQALPVAGKPHGLSQRHFEIDQTFLCKAIGQNPVDLLRRGLRIGQHGGPVHLSLSGRFRTAGGSLGLNDEPWHSSAFGGAREHR